MDSVQPSTPPERISLLAVVIFGALILMGVTNQIEPDVLSRQLTRVLYNRTSPTSGRPQEKNDYDS